MVSEGRISLLQYCNLFLLFSSSVVSDSVTPWTAACQASHVFDAAVDGYPMLHAKASKVAQRALPDGTEYLFTAVDLPREGGPDIPPVSEMTVYVTVANGTTPVFTRVVR